MRTLLLASVAVLGLAGAAFAHNATPTARHFDPATTASTQSSYCSASADFSDNCTSEPDQANAGMHSRSVASHRAPSTTEMPSNGCAATADFSDNC